MRSEKRFPKIAGWLGLTAALLGLTAWTGSFLGLNAAVDGAAAGFLPPEADTAAALIVLGMVLLNLAGGGPRWITLAGAGGMVGLAGIALVANALNADQRLDALLLHSGFGGTQAGRMPAVSGLSFGLAAAALMCAVSQSGRAWRSAASWLAAVVVALALASFYVLLLGTVAGDEIAPRLRPNGPLAGGLALIGFGVLVLQDGERFAARLLARTPSGRLVRRLFFGLTLAPALLSVILVGLLRAQMVGLVDGVGLFTVALLGSGLAITLFSLEAASRLDESREAAEAARLHLTARLQEQAAQLQETVAARTRELREANASLQAAAEANARLALVANHATNGVVICDPQGRVEWVNASFELMTGFSLAELKGNKPGHLLQGAATDPATVAKLRHAITRGEACNVEILNYSKLGRPYWVIVDIQPVRDSSGQVINFIGVQTDVSEQRQVQARLEAANLRMQLANEAAGLGVWEGDYHADRCDWDDRMLTIYGLARDEFHGTYADWAQRLHPDDAEEAQRTLTEIQQGKEPFVRVFRIVRASDGAVRFVQSRVVVRRDAAGRLLGCTGAERDITAEREATRRLQELNERLQLALDSSRFGVWEVDFKTGEMLWDDNMLMIYGVRREDCTGTRADWVRRLHPDDTKDHACDYYREDHDVYSTAFRIVRPDGAVRHIESHCKQTRDAQNRVIRLVGINRDVTETHEANQNLRDLNERFQLALRSSQFGVWETDLRTGSMLWDDRMLEIYGITRAAFDGRRETWNRAIHSDDRPEALRQVQRAVTGEDACYDSEFRIVRPDGTIRHIEAHGQLSLDRDGRPLRLVGLNRDISLERKTEAALHLVEERWQLALEGNNDGVWDWDITSGHFFYDTRYSVMLGYTLGELPNHITGHLRLVHPDDRADFDRDNQAHLDGRLPFFQHEHRMQAKNGDWVWILDRAKVVSRAPDGRALRMVGTHTDITARKQLEQRLRQAEELSQQVGQLALIGGWELKLTSGQLIFTEGARRIHDLAGEAQPTLEQALDFFPGEARETLRAAMFGRTPALPSFDFEFPFVSATGRSLWVRVIGRADFREGRAVALRGAIQDITARHESESARRELEGQLFQAQKMETLGTLAGGIAHDFNNLLTGIIGYHELAADTIPEDHPARACLIEARGASMRARDLVEQILTFSRQSAGEEHEAVDLSLVLKEAGRFLRATLAANVIIETDIPDNCARVLANTTQIYQVLLNLGSNAAHAMRPNGGTLRIGLLPVELGADRAGSLGGATPGHYLRLDVSDTGHGMDAATLRRIFDPFFTTKNTREGTGLGLAVVHGIIRAHRGAIDVESTPGQGTAFHIYLPVAEQTLASDPGDQANAPAGHGQLVYVVDDEELVGRFIKMALEGIGYRVEAFASAEACLAACDRPGARCDLLLTDQTMPGQQGTELAAALQHRWPELPVIIMSGYFSKVPSQSLGELRNAHLLAKPFTTDELAHALNRAWQAAANPSAGET